MKKDKLEGQLERARKMAVKSYSKEFLLDADVIKFLLDRLERVEKAMTKACETVTNIDWAP